jgi:hypothetical protein
MKKAIVTAVLAAAVTAGGLSLPALVRAQPIVPFLFGGHQYCWYDAGWQGAGWYWCGYAERRGYGWGGGAGWHGHGGRSMAANRGGHPAASHPGGPAHGPAGGSHAPANHGGDDHGGGEHH